MKPKQDFTSWLKSLNIKVDNIAWFERAFTHRSFLNEVKKEPIKSNERLEYLGDAVLELIVSQFLFNHYPQKEEGKLTFMRAKIVQTLTLGKTAQKLKMDQFLKMSKGERLAEGQKNLSILADTFEAFLGALFKDQGLEVCRKFIQKHLLSRAEQLVKDKTIIDYKSLFQEKIQSAQKGTPKYLLIRTWGPDHNKTFKVSALVGKKPIASGIGKNKQQAEQNAAQKALEKIKKII